MNLLSIARTAKQDRHAYSSDWIRTASKRETVCQHDGDLVDVIYTDDRIQYV